MKPVPRFSCSSTMLKLLLAHWQSHREPLPFVLTDDPLYCSHLTKSPFPEVYSVNRINPIFEEDEEQTNNNVHTLSSKSKTVNNDHKEKLIYQRSISDQKGSIAARRFISDQISENGASDSSSIHLKGSLNEERREIETRISDDTGYSSSEHLKSVSPLDSDAESLAVRRMSSDSGDYSHPEELVVAADVHRVSYADDVIVLPSSSSSSRSQTFSANSYSAGSSSASSQELLDSLNMTDENPVQVSTDAKRPNFLIKEKLQKLLEKGNKSSEVFLDSLDGRPIVPTNQDIEKTKVDLMKSLTRALSNKVSNIESVSPLGSEMITRTDSSLGDSIAFKSLDRKSNSSSTTPKTLLISSKSDSNTVTRQDESSASSSISLGKTRKYHQRIYKHNAIEVKRGSMESTNESSNSKKSHKCKLCENAHRPLAFHQLLPGHWSYDNVYLPQMSGVCYSCMYHNPALMSSLDDKMLYHFYNSHHAARNRHSWAPYTNSKGFLENTSTRRSLDSKTILTGQKGNSHETLNSRYSADGSSRDTDNSPSDNILLRNSLSERRSLREPKKCKCDFCLGSVLDKNKAHLHPSGSHTCSCQCISHRRVKFASDTDLSQHRHMHSIPVRLSRDITELPNAAVVMNLSHLNGHIIKNSKSSKDNGLDYKKLPTLVPRGLKEPIKMDDLYRSYPMHFQDWEVHHHRAVLRKRRKRALTMVAMAIAIVLMVGTAVAIAFVFLRLRRTV